MQEIKSIGTRNCIRKEDYLLISHKFQDSCYDDLIKSISAKVLTEFEDRDVSIYFDFRNEEFLIFDFYKGISMIKNQSVIHIIDLFHRNIVEKYIKQSLNLYGNKFLVFQKTQEYKDIYFECKEHFMKKIESLIKSKMNHILFDVYSEKDKKILL